MTIRPHSILCLTIVLAGLAGCNSEPGGAAGSDAPVELKGSGASFPNPLYQRWFTEYCEKHPTVKIEYASVGSGAGIKQFTEGLVDFGASDAAMDDEEIAKVKEGVQLLPMTAGSIVLCYNLTDADGKPVEGLKLSRAAYSGIFLGDVTMWNDPLIADANPGVKLPEKQISVAWRSDSSGTTYVFTQHLSAVSEKWKNGPGTDKSVKWPVGAGAPKNDGVAGAVKGADGSIGYVEYGFAHLNKIPMAWLENQAGKFVEPTPENATAALDSLPELPADMRVWLPDPAGDSSYPIVTYTWILCRKTYPDEHKLKTLKAALKYCLTEGQAAAPELGYISLPKSVSEKVIAAMDNITVAAGATTESKAATEATK